MDEGEDRNMKIDPKKIKVGDTVWWDDPDGGLSSGIYRVMALNIDAEDPYPDDSTIVVLNNDAGSEAEAPLWELKDPDGRRRTEWSDIRLWMAARAVCDIAPQMAMHHPSFEPYICDDDPVASLIATALFLARFEGRGADEVLEAAKKSFQDVVDQRGQDTYCGEWDKERTEWAHRTMTTYTSYRRGDGVDLMARLARLSDTPAKNLEDSAGGGIDSPSMAL